MCTQTFASTSGTPFVPFHSSLWDAKAIPENLFSTYLTMNTTGSVLTVGGMDKSLMDVTTLVSQGRSRGVPTDVNFAALLWTLFQLYVSLHALTATVCQYA